MEESNCLNNCLICNSDKKETIFDTFDRRFGFLVENPMSYQLVRCLNCGFVFLSPRPKTVEELAEAYPREYWQQGVNSFFEKHFLDFFIWIKYRKIVKMKKQGKILDIGCGTGEMLSFFKKKGWMVYGQDISNFACKKAGKIIDNIYCGALKDAGFKKRSFDVIILNSVLHQMTDPAKELSVIGSLIKKDGVSMISVPDISSWQYKLSGKNWFHIDSPRHFYYFQPESIKAFLRMAGFEVIKVSRPFWECPLDLFHSCKSMFWPIFWPIFLPLSLFLRFIPKFRGAMEVVATLREDR